jgi:hypothetical protein
MLRHQKVIATDDNNYFPGVRSLSVSSFIEKELRMQLRMKRKRKGEREEKETPPAWEQTVNILFMHGVIAQGKRAPGGGGFLSNTSSLHMTF